MTPRRRQGSGRRAFDQIGRQLAESLSNLSKLTAAQASIGWAVQDRPNAATDALERLDDEQLQAVADAAGFVKMVALQLQAQDDEEGGSP